MKKLSTTVKMKTNGHALRAIKPAQRKKSSIHVYSSEHNTRAAARSDTDNPPLTKELLARLKPASRVRTLRRALSLTQEEFAARFHIPLGTLRDWEQGRSTPDQPTRAYLIVIANDPEHVRKSLERERSDFQ